MEEEIWVPISGVEDKYEVSNFGRVRSLDIVQYRSNGQEVCRFEVKGRILKPFMTGKTPRYPTVQIEKRNRKVHRLVAEAFIPNPNNYPEVNHIDGDKTNNCVSNLEWTTTKENIHHAVRNGLMRTGSSSPCSKLTEEDVINIKKEYKPNTIGCGAKSLAKKYGVSDVTIRRILKGKKWCYIEG